MSRNDCLLKVLNQQPSSRLPVWFMRQAGRYLPEYRALREKAGSFWELCKNPEWATEATLQPIERYDLDAAILFSDILTIPDAMGMSIEFMAGKGPVFNKPLCHEKDIEALPLANMERLRYVFDAIRSIKVALDSRLPLIGFSGSPVTLASYMVEGESSRDFLKLRRLIHARPTLAHQLFQKITHSVIDYLSHQIEAGVDVIMIFDTWGGLLDPISYHDYNLTYLKIIIDTLRQKSNIPIIHYAKGIHDCVYPAIADTGVNGIGIDWTSNLKHVHTILGNRSITLQGNLDPAILACDESTIRRNITRILEDTRGMSHIFNLGHGIPLDTSPQAIEWIIDTIRTHHKF